MFFDPDQWFAVVTGNAVKSTGVRKDEVLKRVCARNSEQRTCGSWGSQPAVIVDDGRVRWTVTFSEKVAHDGRKKVAYIVEGDRYAEEPIMRRSRFWT
jgi:hypothetical protein